MSFTVDGIVTELRREFLGRTSADTGYDALVVGWLNDVHNLIWFESRWKFEAKADYEFPMVPTQQEYLLDATLGEITHARMKVSDRPITLVGVEQLIRAQIDLEATGSEPDYLWISGYDSATGKIKIKLQPIPTSTRTISMPNLGVIVDLAAGATIPLPNDFRVLYKIGGRALCYEDQGDLDDSKLQWALFNSLMEDIKNRYEFPVNDNRERSVQDTRTARNSGPRAPSGYVITG